MSTISPRTFETPPDDSSVPTDPIFRLSVDQYHEMIRTGILTADDRIELLEGWLIPKMSKNPPRRVATELAADALWAVVPKGWYVTTQEPVTTSTSEPEPDISVVRGRRGITSIGIRVRKTWRMLVEIADSSISRDRGIKRLVYARAAVRIYWIVDVTERLVEVYSLPSGPTAQPAYAMVQPYGADEKVAVMIGGQEVGRILAREMLP